MAASSEDRQALHAARLYLYTLGQLLLGNEPTAQNLEAAHPELLADAVEIAGLPDDHGVTELLQTAAEDPEAACSLYTRLFIGPVTPKATPWESTYRSRSKALFRQETLDVRNAYRACGYLPQAYPKVADDHIALELGFLAALADRAVTALGTGDPDAVTAAESASSDFLNDHLLVWIDDYAEDLASAAPGSLYEALIRLMADLAHADQEALSVV